MINPSIQQDWLIAYQVWDPSGSGGFRYITGLQFFVSWQLIASNLRTFFKSVEKVTRSITDNRINFYLITKVSFAWTVTPRNSCRSLSAPISLCNLSGPVVTLHFSHGQKNPREVAWRVLFVGHFEQFSFFLQTFNKVQISCIHVSPLRRLIPELSTSL